MANIVMQIMLVSHLIVILQLGNLLLTFWVPQYVHIHYKCKISSSYDISNTDSPMDKMPF